MKLLLLLNLAMFCLSTQTNLKLIARNSLNGNIEEINIGSVNAELVEMGKSNNWIMKHLGMDADEVIRLKQITGIAALFKDSEFSKSWDVNK